MEPQVKGGSADGACLASLRREGDWCHAPRIVEFFGLPGTGKTTIANQCIAIARSFGGAVYSSDDVKGMFLSNSVIGRVGRIAAAGPFAWWPIYLALQAPPFRQLRSESSIRYRARSAFNAPVYFLPLRDMECDAESAIVLLDEWITQKLWATSLFGECKPSAAADFVRHFVMCFDVQYVILDLDPDTAAERAYHRTLRRRQGLESHRHPIFDHMDKTDLVAAYQRGHEIFLRICELFDVYSRKLVRIDGSRSVEDNTRIIIDTLLRPHAATVTQRDSCSDVRNRLNAFRGWRQWIL